MCINVYNVYINVYNVYNMYYIEYEFYIIYKEENFGKECVNVLL